jgi:hypothetical protein
MSGHFNVKPRYGAGSPAQVDEHTAKRVAEDERAAFEHARSGAYGTLRQIESTRDGLRGIVELRVERPGAWIVTDLLTGERFVRPFDVHGETPIRQQQRHWRLRAKFGLPLERELPAIAAAVPR